MKVVIDARLYGLENRGLGRYLMNFVNELKKYKNLDFVIILRKDYFNKLKLPPNFKKVCFDVRHYSFLEQVLLPFILYREKPDLVHFPHFNVPVFYFGKYVVTIHDMLMHKFKGVSSTTLPYPLYQIKRFFYSLVFKHAVVRSRLVFVPTKAVANELIENFKVEMSKIRVTYEGVNKFFLNGFLSINELYTKYNLFRNYIIYCGNSYPHKNIGLVFESMRYLEKKAIESFGFLVISSPNSFRKGLEKKVKEMGLENRVVFLDFVPDRDLASLMHHSLAYVFPSLSEGFGLPGLEAIAAGTLLLASDIPVFREVYQDSCFYFDPQDPRDLARVIISVLEMKDNERKRKIESAQELLKRYSWSKMTGIVIDSYKKLLQSPFDDV
jgi:glycosyltransferase involved in cell wall biosynthesis